MGRIASFHLVRERSGRGALALTRLATDRRRLATVPGLVFWRVLGTGRGDDTGPSVDWRRTALFAVWRDEVDLDMFLGRSAVADRWRRAEESWHVRLRAVGGHGTWRGTALLDLVDHVDHVDHVDQVDPAAGAGPLAVVTRADVHRRAWREFRAASHEVSAEVRRAAGLIDVVGFGEAPVGRLGTFSLWRRAEDVRAFAATMPRHREVVRRTRAAGWYGEELFARFAPSASSGTWDGRDPLAR